VLSAGWAPGRLTFMYSYRCNLRSHLAQTPAVSMLYAALSPHYQGW
jgi:hypothetical protein